MKISIENLLQYKAKVKGASALEMALAMPVFVVSVLVIIDLARYFFSYGMLQYSVEKAADLAAKFEIETKTDATSCQQNRAACEAYVLRVNEILRAAADSANIISSVDDNSSVRRSRVEHYWDGDNQNSSLQQQIIIGDAPQTFSSNYGVAFMRPGESVKFYESDGVTSTVYDYSFHDSPGRKAWPTLSQTWTSTLQNYPVEVVIRGRFHPLIPILPDFPLTAQAFAYRKAGAFSRPPNLYPDGAIGDVISSNSSSSAGNGSGGSSSGSSVSVVDCACCRATPRCANIKCYNWPCRGRGGG